MKRPSPAPEAPFAAREAQRRRALAARVPVPELPPMTEAEYRRAVAPPMVRRGFE